MIRKLKIYLARRKLERLIRAHRQPEGLWLKRRNAARKGWQTRRERASV